MGNMMMGGPGGGVPTPPPQQAMARAKEAAMNLDRALQTYNQLAQGLGLPAFQLVPLGGGGGGGQMGGPPPMGGPGGPPPMMG